jgi:hypothetical protein
MPLLAVRQVLREYELDDSKRVASQLASSDGLSVPKAPRHERMVHADSDFDSACVAMIRKLSVWL